MTCGTRRSMSSGSPVRAVLRARAPRNARRRDRRARQYRRRSRTKAATQTSGRPRRTAHHRCQHPAIGGDSLLQGSVTAAPQHLTWTAPINPSVRQPEQSWSSTRGTATCLPWRATRRTSPATSSPISQDRFQQLNADPAAGSALTNRAVTGLYPPGYTFKIFTAVAALRAGLVAPGQLYRGRKLLQASEVQRPPEMHVEKHRRQRSSGPLLSPRRHQGLERLVLLQPRLPVLSARRVFDELAGFPVNDVETVSGSGRER